MQTEALVDFTDPKLLALLEYASQTALDELQFGVIGFDPQGSVRQYNTWESKAAGLSQNRVIGQPLFTVVAPCMNNYLVAHAFEDAEASGAVLDKVIPYVLTLRMKPTKVQLRLLSRPGAHLRYVLVKRFS